MKIKENDNKMKENAFFITIILNSYSNSYHKRKKKLNKMKKYKIFYVSIDSYVSNLKKNHSLHHT